jgi:hypothetical protein
MDSTANRLTGEQMARLISEGKACPFPKPAYKPHDYNAEKVRKVMALSPEQRKIWLEKQRKRRSEILDSLGAKQ